MQVIWKYELEIKDAQFILMPSDAEPLCVMLQHDVICVWVKCDNTRPKATMRIQMRGTGHPNVPEEAKHIGSIMMYDGSLVYHVFWG